MGSFKGDRPETRDKHPSRAQRLAKAIVQGWIGGGWDSDFTRITNWGEGKWGTVEVGGEVAINRLLSGWPRICSRPKIG